MANKEALQKINKVGEDFGWLMGKISANYENGYMQAIRDCKAVFQKDEHFREETKKVVTNADRIRNMSDEELFELLDEYGFCKLEKNGKCEHMDDGCSCSKCTLEWLKEKVE